MAAAPRPNSGRVRASEGEALPTAALMAQAIEDGPAIAKKGYDGFTTALSAGNEAAMSIAVEVYGLLRRAVPAISAICKAPRTPAAGRGNFGIIKGDLFFRNST